MSDADDKKKAEDEALVNQTEQEQAEAVQDYSAGAEDQLTMHVKVHSPFHEYYDGMAFSISAENATGPFDILPKHHNFITLLNPCDLVIRTTKKGDQRIRISGGIMHVKADKIVVFLDV